MPPSLFRCGKALDGLPPNQKRMGKPPHATGGRSPTKAGFGKAPLALAAKNPLEAFSLPGGFFAARATFLHFIC